MKVFDILDNLKNIYLTDSMIEILTDFERVIDELDLYVFENWQDGELVEGPITERYFVTCTFMWPLKSMPNPSGGERLLDYGIKVSYKKDKLSFPRKIQTAADFRPGTKKPKIDKMPVWFVEIKMPKKLMSDIRQGYIEMQGETIDFEDIDDAFEQDLDQEGITDIVRDEQDVEFEQNAGVI